MFHSPNLVLSLLFEILVLLFLSMLAFHVRLVAFLALLGLSLRFFTRIALVIFALLFILAMLRLLRIILVPWALHSWRHSSAIFAGMCFHLSATNHPSPDQFDRH